MAVSRETIAAVRFGYGFHVDQPAPKDAAALMAQLDAPLSSHPKVDNVTRSQRVAQFVEFMNAVRTFRKDKSAKPQMKAVNKKLDKSFLRDTAFRLRASILSPYGFYERLAFFWADHFTVTGRTKLGKSLVARFEQEAIRPHIAGDFASMLRAVTTHPAMLAFLNQNQSIGPTSKIGQNKGKGLNENLARELIELHTLGVDGAYTQDDVRQLAELLTGLTFKRRTGEMVFRPRVAEPGAEVILGKSYGGGNPKLDDILSFLDDLARRPDTARYLAWKIAVHFTSPDPSDAFVAHLANALISTGGSLPALYEAMLAHPEAWDTFGAKVKQPYDYVVSSVRAVGLSEGQLRPVLRGGGDLAALKALRDMNQPIYMPNGPDGWPEGEEAWITPQGLAARLQWAAKVGRAVERKIDPRDFLTMALGDNVTEEVAFAATRAAERWEGLAFVLASPEFNRR